METTLHPLFIVLLGIAIQIVFACFVYGLLMVLNYVFVDLVDDQEVKKFDVEKGQILSQRLYKTY